MAKTVKAPKAEPSTPPKPEKKAPTPTLPASLVVALSSSKGAIEAVQQLERQLPSIIREFEKAKKAGPVPLARAYVVYHRLMSRMEEAVKMYAAFQAAARGVIIPEQFELAGVPNVTIDEGFRIGISSRILASIIPDKKTEAYQWLRDNGLGDIIGETVNASTLSATAKSLVEDQNKELPDTLFRVAYVPNTSVTKTK